MHRSKALITVLLAFLLLGGGFALWKMRSVKPEIDQQPQDDTVGVENVQNIEGADRFVTDVDPDVSHWQTKETEFFTIKFPKEWYLVETDQKVNSDYSIAITNNQKFPINKYPDMRFFPGHDYAISFDDLGERGIVIAFRVDSTQNSGTPRDSIDWQIESAKKSRFDVKCSQEKNTNENTLVAYCAFIARDGEKAESRKVQTYFRADKINTTKVTGWTINKDILSKDILGKISQNFVVH